MHGFLGQYGSERVVEDGRRVACEEREGEHLEQRRVGQVGIGIERFAPFPEQHCPADELGHALGLREGGAHLVGHDRGDFVVVFRLAAGRGFLDQHPVDAVALDVEVVVAPLVADEQQDEQAAGHPHGQPDHVDGRVACVLAEGAEGDEEVVLQHGAIRSGGP